MILEIWKTRNIVTFLGIAFAITGIWFCCMNQTIWAIWMLIFAGIFDAFDGTVAKKISNQDDEYGIQLDSLADIISFGVLPVCIAISMGYARKVDLIIYAVYMICGITRLAYFNVKSAGQQYFMGLPITSSSIILPLMFLLIKNEVIYMIVFAMMAAAFVTDFKIKKPTTKIKILLSVLGIVVAICICKFNVHLK